MRDRVGLNVPPLLLRLMLGVVFIWAGLGKISASFKVEGEDAAILANLGVIAPPGNTTVVTPPAAAPASPAPTGTPAEEPPKPSGRMHPEDAGAARIVLVQQSGGAYKASDFTSPVPVLNVHGLTLVIYKAAHPVSPVGGTAMPLWPKDLGEGRWPRYLAWAVAITELVGGAALLLGLFTRVMALAVAGVMVGAIWLTQIGPAIQSGSTKLGFLPDYPAFDAKWQTLFFQFSLLMAALALAFSGPGRASLDRAILGGPHGKDDDDEAE